MAGVPYRSSDGAPAPAESPPLPALAEGDLLVVPKGISFPEVCLKCGQKRDLHLKQHRFGFARQPTMGKRVLWGALLGPIGGAVATAQATEYASFALPLCARCESRWTDAKIATIVAVLPLIGTAIWLFALMTNRAPGDEVLAPALVFLATIVLAVVVQRTFVPPRTIRCLGIDGRYVKLAGVSEAARAALLGDRPAKRKKKKKMG
jgi:hypothetical protein